MKQKHTVAEPSNFYSKYLLFDFKKHNLKSIQKFVITNSKELSLYKSDLFAILDKKHIAGVYNDLISCPGGFDISVIVAKLSTLESFEKVKEKLVSYFGIYQKTKNVSSVYLFDKENLTFVELTSGCLDGDDLVKELIDEIINKFEKQHKKDILERHDFICEIEFDSEEYNELID